MDEGRDRLASWMEFTVARMRGHSVRVTIDTDDLEAGMARLRQRGESLEIWIELEGMIDQIKRRSSAELEARLADENRPLVLEFGLQHATEDAARAAVRGMLSDRRARAANRISWLALFVSVAGLVVASFAAT